jgi:hypothetical protein
MKALPGQALLSPFAADRCGEIDQAIVQTLIFRGRATAHELLVASLSISRIVPAVTLAEGRARLLALEDKGAIACVRSEASIGVWQLKRATP